MQNSERANAISETEKLRCCDERTHYWPIGNDPPAGTPCKCGKTLSVSRAPMPDAAPAADSRDTTNPRCQRPGCAHLQSSHEGACLVIDQGARCHCEGFLKPFNCGMGDPEICECAADSRDTEADAIDAKRWRIMRDKMCVVSSAPGAGNYYIASDFLPPEVPLTALSPDAFADALLRAASVPEGTNE